MTIILQSSGSFYVMCSFQFKLYYFDTFFWKIKGDLNIRFFLKQTLVLYNMLHIFEFSFCVYF